MTTEVRSAAAPPWRPGPYHYLGRGKERGHIVAAMHANGVYVGTVDIAFVFGRSDAEIAAHGHLLAAAHDLHEALTAAERLDWRDDCPECGGEREPELCPRCFPLADEARLKRRAALAKARGDQP